MILTRIVLLACAFGLVVASLLECNAISKNVQVAPNVFERMCLVVFGTTAVFLVLLGFERYVRGAVWQGIIIPLFFTSPLCLYFFFFGLADSLTLIHFHLLARRPIR